VTRDVCLPFEEKLQTGERPSQLGSFEEPKFHCETREIELI